MQVWPLHASIHYCKNRIRSILNRLLSVGMVQHITGKILKQVQFTLVNGKTSH